MSKDLIDILKYIGMAVGAVLILVCFMLFCTGCAYEKFDFDKFWSNSSTRIETPGLITPSTPRGHIGDSSVAPGPVYSYPTGLEDGSYTTLP